MCPTLSPRIARARSCSIAGAPRNSRISSSRSRSTMTSEFRETRGRDNFMWRERQLLRLPASLDRFRITKAIAELQAWQLELERSQHEIENLLRRSQAEIEAVRQAADENTSLAGMLDIKNLGYELGRRLAEEKLAPRPIQI